MYIHIYIYICMRFSSYMYIYIYIYTYTRFGLRVRVAWPPLTNPCTAVGVDSALGADVGGLPGDAKPCHGTRWRDQCMYVCMHACMHVCTYVYVRICMCICVWVRVRVCVCVCVCVSTETVPIELKNSPTWNFTRFKGFALKSRVFALLGAKALDFEILWDLDP